MEKIVIWKGSPKEIESIVKVQKAFENMCDIMENCECCPFAEDNDCLMDKVIEQIDNVMEYNETYFS